MVCVLTSTTSGPTGDDWGRRKLLLKRNLLVATYFGSLAGVVGPMKHGTVS